MFQESQCRIKFDPRLLDLIRSKQKYSITRDSYLVESNVFIANFVVQKARGLQISKVTRDTITAKPMYQAYHDFCEEELGSVVYDSVILRELLCASELKFEKYLRNEQWVSKIKDFCRSRDQICHNLGVIMQRQKGCSRDQFENGCCLCVVRYYEGGIRKYSFDFR